MAPAPISWPPSQYWDGDDGSWSSFALRVGTPAQTVRVLPSTAGQETWVVSPIGCPHGRNGTSTSLTCEESRGGFFDTALSSTWASIGNYVLALEVNLGYSETAPYGFDTVALGLGDSIGGPTINSQVVSAIATDDFYMGVFGLGHQGTNVSNFTDPHPSFLSVLKNESLIPSLSWGYTAGAPYRSKGVFGSLTFGGYDSSRFIRNNVRFNMATDISRDLVVSLESITSTAMNTSFNQPESLLPSPILTFIDSTIPYIYLPLEACRKFENTLGLSWNDTAEMYWVNDTLHQALLSSDLSFTFTIGDTIAGGSTVQIVLPYASFDLEAKYPFALDTMRYFPLQRAANDSQYTLGRSFLQEAYIITDYERSNFSVSQCLFEDNNSMSLVPISSAKETRSHVQRNVAIGVSIGVVSFLLLTFLGIIFATRSIRKAKSQVVNNKMEQPTPSREPRALTISSRPREIDHNSVVGPVRELPDSGKVELLDDHSPTGSGNEVSEMSQALAPVAHELRTHRSSQVMIQTRTANTCRIFKSTKISRKSWTSVASSDGTPRVETVISALTRQKEFDVDGASVITSSLEAEIYSSYMRKSLDLDRSLPATPISESPQMSPLIVKFNRRSSFTQRPRIVQAPQRVSMSAFLSPEIPVSRYSLASNKHKRLPVAVSLTGLETVVPPAHSDPTAVRKSSRPTGKRRTHRAWF